MFIIIRIIRKGRCGVEGFSVVEGSCDRFSEWVLQRGEREEVDTEEAGDDLTYSGGRRAEELMIEGVDQDWCAEQKLGEVWVGLSVFS